MLPERAAEILQEVFAEAIPRPDAGPLRVSIDGEAVRFVTFQADGSVEQVIEQPVVLLPAREVDEERYRRFAEGVRAALVRRVGAPVDTWIPADFFRPNVILDPGAATAQDVADLLLDVDRLARAVGPFEVGVWLDERGLDAVDAESAALLWRLLHDDFEVARVGAVGLAARRAPGVPSAVLAILEDWAGYFERAVWWTSDGRNAHHTLGTIAAHAVRHSDDPDHRRRLLALALLPAGEVDPGRAAFVSALDSGLGVAGSREVAPGQRQLVSVWREGDGLHLHTETVRDGDWDGVLAQRHAVLPDLDAVLAALVDLGVDPADLRPGPSAAGRAIQARQELPMADDPPDTRPTEEERARREHTRLLAATRVVPSVDDHTWIQLLLAYVDGRPKAAHILGDYLEGEGHPRIRNADADQRLRHALGLLPPVLAHDIACDFVDHVLTVDRSGGSFAQLVTVKRQWLNGLATDAQLKAARKVAQGAVHSAVSEAVAHALVSSPAPGVAQSTSHLAATAVATLRVHGVRHGDWHNAYRDEIRWQVGHVRGRLGRGGR